MLQPSSFFAKELFFLGRRLFDPQGDFFCLGISMMSRHMQAGAILGATMLQGLYLEFDRTRWSLGVAPARQFSSRPCGRPPTWSRRIPAAWTVSDVGAASQTRLLRADSCNTCTSQEGAWCEDGRIEVSLIPFLFLSSIFQPHPRFGLMASATPSTLRHSAGRGRGSAFPGLQSRACTSPTTARPASTRSV